MSKLTNSLRGTGVALITPFKKDLSVDYPSLGKLVDYIIGNGCEYIVVLGTTGESATLTKKEKVDIVEFVKKKNRSRIRLVLGLGGNNTQSIIDEMGFYSFKNIDAMLSVSPYYNKPTQQGIYIHYKAIAKNSPVPVILYNVPSRTASNITAETTLKIARECKNVIGIKEASGNMEQCMTIIKNRPKDFLVISGDDAITLPLIASGADGVISVVANSHPKGFSEMVRASLKNDFIKARKLHYNIFEIIPLLFAEGNPAGVKCVLKFLKVTNDYLRLPLTPVSKLLEKQLIHLTRKAMVGR